MASTAAASPSSAIYGWVWLGAVLYALSVILWNAYKIRMGAIEEFGPVIHEFDPYFNFRATEVCKGINKSHPFCFLF
jgi:dolichyl-diphosphooligosaccharide--protein glycosyltransferase